jgi:hypothetical protein
LFGQMLPVGVRELPADLAALDRLLADRLLLALSRGDQGRVTPPRRWAEPIA